MGKVPTSKGFTVTTTGDLPCLLVLV